MSQLNKRVSALEAVHSPDGSIICFWAMNGCQPMTEEEIEKGMAALRADSPANARIISVTWLAPTDPA